MHITYKKFIKKKKEMIDYTNKLEKYLYIKKINEEICEEKESLIEFLKQENNIEEFINFSINLNQNFEDVKEFLYSKFKEDKLMKSKIEKIENGYSEIESINKKLKTK